MWKATKLTTQEFLASIANLATLLALLLGAGCSQLSDKEVSALSALLKVNEGETVADVGAGDGALLPLLARSVGKEGALYLTEIDAAKVEELRALAANSEYSQVSVVQGTATHTGLDADCCDIIVTRMVYHHFTNPEDFILSLYKSLKPGGRLLIIDFQPSRWMSSSTPDDLPTDREEQHGITPELIISEVSQYGFTLQARVNDWPGPGSLVLSHFALLFVRDEVRLSPAPKAA